MSTFKMQVQKLTGSKITSLSNATANVAIYHTETADQEDVYLVRYGTADQIHYRPINPEEEMFRYVENLHDAIKEAIQEGNEIYICEEVQEYYGMEDPDGYFWKDLLQELKEAAL